MTTDTPIQNFGVFLHYLSLQMVVNYFILKNYWPWPDHFDDFGDESWLVRDDFFDTLF